MFETYFEGGEDYGNERECMQMESNRKAEGGDERKRIGWRSYSTKIIRATNI